MLIHKHPENWEELLEEAFSKPHKECSWDEQEIRRKRSKVVARGFANRIIERALTGSPWSNMPIPQDFEELAPKYRPDKRIPQADLKKWYKNPLFRAQIMSEIQKRLEGLGIEKADVLEFFAETFRMAKENGSINERNAVFDRLDKVFGITETTTASESYTYTPPPIPTKGGGNVQRKIEIKRKSDYVDVPERADQIEFRRGGDERD